MGQNQVVQLFASLPARQQELEQLEDFWIHNLETYVPKGLYISLCNL